ncbi:MAG: cytochrome b5 domain-containing protein [Candidatus Zhuqueibacterota bacterium]
MEISKHALAENSGKEGKPSYVVVNGKVYDVTKSKMWKNGLHMNRHHAGQDLSEALGAAPHGAEVLDRYPEIGVLQSQPQDEVKPPLPAWLNKFFETYPFFKRHPHPMVVHFPMTFFITATIFLLWYHLISQEQSLLDGVKYMHILGTLSLPFALITGWLSWKVNYMGKPIGNITRKIIFSLIVLIFDVVVLVSVIQNPTVLASPQGAEIALPVMVLLYLPIISYIGQQGGDLVY